MIYFDNNSTTKFSPSVVRYLQEDCSADWGNASSEHLFGQNLKKIIEEDRSYISNFLDVSKNTLLFTSGATESINSIIHPIFFNANKIGTIISSKIEHEATLAAIDRLGKAGITVLWVENDKNGMIIERDLERLVRENPHALVSLLYANNETGVVQNARKIVEICKEYGCLIHLDSAQMLGKGELNLSDLNLDFASFSAHKIGGLKGMGLLYVKNPDNFVPFILGGGQEQGLRGGTYNLNGIRSFRLALEDAQKWRVKNIKELRDSFERQVLEISDGIIINCQDSDRICNTSNVFFPNIPSQAVVLELSRNDICASTGSACNSGTADPSHVIQGLDLSKEYAASCLRFSLADFNTHDEINQTVRILKKIISK